MILLYLELLNGALGLALIMLALIIVRDFKKEFYSRGIRVRIPITFTVLGIVTFSIKELYKYGPFDNVIDPVIAESLEMLYLVFTLIAAFFILGLKR